MIKVRQVLSTQLSPTDIFLALEAQFKSELRAAKLVQVIDRLEKEIRQEHENVGKIYIEIEA